MTDSIQNILSDEHVFDYSKITDQIYIGSDFCTGRACLLHGDEFKKLGVCAEINLAAEKKEIPPDDIDIYAWLPVVDKQAPTEDQLIIGSSIINEAVVNGNTIYIHCKNGHGRSPTMVAAYLIRYEKFQLEAAVELLMKMRPEVHIEEVQKEALRKFAEKWK